jgi:hypothetical protein
VDARLFCACDTQKMMAPLVNGGAFAARELHMIEALKAGIASGEWKVAVALFAALAVLMVI